MGQFPQTYSLVGVINSALRLSRPWETTLWGGWDRPMNSISTWLADLEAWHGPAAAAARIVLILAGVWIAQRLVTRLICMFRERITARMTGAEEVRRAETLGRVFRYLATVAVGLMGGVLVFQNAASRSRRSSAPPASSGSPSDSARRAW